MSPSKDQFRRVMGRFATGVTIITTRSGEEVHGMTANSVASLSLDPMLVLVCVDKAADSHDILADAGVFAINVLSRGQWELSNRYAKKETDNAHSFDGVPFQTAETGSPIIDGVLAYLDCRTVFTYEGGDHTIFVGEVLAADYREDQEPLLFYAGRYGRFGTD